MKKQHRIAPDVKEQILKRIKEEGVSVARAAKEHGIAEGTIYGWIGKGVRNAPTIGELVAEIYRTVREYNHTRIHSALKMPPSVFAEKLAA
jgi:transposase-like protein